MMSAGEYDRQRRYRELKKLNKYALAQLHIARGGLLSLREYLTWSKEDLLAEVMEDEHATR